MGSPNGVWTVLGLPGRGCVPWGRRGKRPLPTWFLFSSLAPGTSTRTPGNASATVGWGAPTSPPARRHSGTLDSLEAKCFGRPWSHVRTQFWAFSSGLFCQFNRHLPCSWGTSRAVCPLPYLGGWPPRDGQRCTKLESLCWHIPAALGHVINQRSQALRPNGA